FRYLGESIIPVVLFAVVWWFGYRKQGFLIFLSFFFSILTNFILKVSFCIPRPFVRDPRVIPMGSVLDTATGFSFPSSHTAVAVAYLAPLGIKYRNKLFIPIIVVLVCCLIGFSRMYMGVHAPQDILVSLVLGFFCVILAFKIIEWISDRDDAEIILSIGAFAGFILLLFISLLRDFPDIYFDGQMLHIGQEMQRDLMTMGGALLGFAIGFLCDHFFIHHEGSDSRVFNIIISVVGLALVLIIKKLTGAFFENIGYVYGHALQQTLLILFIITFWPIACRFLQRKFLRY
ncbi:MAG: phosphatase PAP2 family protein, partial [Dehalococcoidales bacterium]|nr:phosphatase PAP2 family protein [Dehalococcoidales bacterium]